MVINAVLRHRDGGIDATIDHAQAYMSSKEVTDIYSTEEPQSAFHARVAFCLDIHNEVSLPALASVWLPLMSLLSLDGLSLPLTVPMHALLADAVRAKVLHCTLMCGAHRAVGGTYDESLSCTFLTSHAHIAGPEGSLLNQHYSTGPFSYTVSTAHPKNMVNRILSAFCRLCGQCGMTLLHISPRTSYPQSAP